MTGQNLSSLPSRLPTLSSSRGARPSPSLEGATERLHRLAASPSCKLSQLLDTVVELAVDLSPSAVGGAIWLTDPNRDRSRSRLLEVGGTLSRSRTQIEREQAETAETLRRALPIQSGPSCSYTAKTTARGERVLFAESRSVAKVPLIATGCMIGFFQIEAGYEHAFSKHQLSRLARLSHCASLLIERFQLRVHARTLGYDIHPVGSSPAFLRLEHQVKQVASDPSHPVLIRGERGTGKEHAAYSIHYFGNRRDQPFVAVNSATFSSGLAGDDLFGHGRGAFTGAETIRAGLFRSAHGGSLFFDEVGDMPADVQAFLLRVLDHGEVRQIGCDKPLRVDVRIIAATNQDLEQLVARGDFRGDLYDRLNVLQVQVPALRDRKQDLPLLADHFLRKACHASSRSQRVAPLALCEVCQQSRGRTCLHPDFQAALSRYEYAGNIRELRNLIIRLSATVTDAEIGPSNLPVANLVPQHDKRRSTSDSSLDCLIRTHIEDVLAKTGGNKTAAAKILEIPLSTMINKMKRLGMCP